MVCQRGLPAAAATLTLALWSHLLPACQSLSLERGRLEAALALGSQQQPTSPEGRLGNFEEDDLPSSSARAGSASGAAEKWADSLRDARASSLRTVARLLASTGRDQPLLKISHICVNFGLDQASCERVRTYLGRVSHLGERRVARVKQLASFPVDKQAVAVRLRDFGCRSSTSNGGGVIADYMRDFCQAVGASAAADGVSRGALDARAVVFYSGDWGQRRRFCFPTIAKTRGIPGDRGNSVLLDLNHNRHWVAVSDVGNQDSPLSSKREELVWRGASTGDCNTSLPGSRMMLASKYFDKDSRIDVGMSLIVQGCDEAKRYYKAPMTMQQLLERKYILVVNGNDKATGLNWILASNSVPFMIEPTIESWLVESSLQAWVHYVPVKPDFSDLGSNLDWARANPVKVSEIAEAGKRHVGTFSDPKTEADVEGAVLTAYLDRVEVVTSGAAADGVADAQC